MKTQEVSEYSWQLTRETESTLKPTTHTSSSFGETAPPTVAMTCSFSSKIIKKVVN